MTNAQRRSGKAARSGRAGLRRLAVLSAAALALATQPVQACALALVMGLDISSSVNSSEYRLQIGGIAAALRDPEIRAAIMADPPVWMTIYEWSGQRQQTDVVGWTRLATPAQIDALAARLDRHVRPYDAFATAIGQSLAYALRRFDALPEACARRLVDLSGDGVSNEGRQAIALHPEAAQRGVTVNALVIKGGNPDPEAHYRYGVITGPGAFLLVARNGFEDYPDLIKGKLLRELLPEMLLGARDAAR
ncbi:MAG: DUF1194 domain-containing protein [Pseudomonadota bacterium]